MTPSFADPLVTPRTRLRRWRPEDRAPFAALNADARVMEHFPALLGRAESDALVDRIEADFAARGFGFWALEIPGVLPFAGFVGLSVPSFSAPFTPCVEIGWRLPVAAWGHGYAREAARAALQYGFGPLSLAEIVSFTAVENVRSQKVMEAIGMQRDRGGDFDHPRIARGHRLERHVLYRINAPERSPR